MAKEAKFGSYRLTYSDDWEIKTVVPFPISLPFPDVFTGIIPLVSGKDLLGVQPRYTPPDEDDFYISYVTKTSEGKGRLVVARVNSERSQVLFNVPLPQLPVGDYYINEPHVGTAEQRSFIRCGASYITFSNPTTMWVFIFLHFPNNPNHRWVGILGAFPLEYTSYYYFVTWTPPSALFTVNKLWNYPIVPTRDGMLLAYNTLISHTEPPPQGSGTVKWLFAWTEVSDSSVTLNLSAHLLPSDAHYLAFAPYKFRCGFNTEDKVVVPSSYEELYWEWNDNTKSFVQSSGTPLNYITTMPIFAWGYRDNFVNIAVYPMPLHAYITHIQMQAYRPEVFLAALLRQNNPPYPYKAGVLNPSIWTLDIGYPTVSNEGFSPPYIEGDGRHVLMSVGMRKIHLIDLFTGEFSTPITISPTDTEGYSESIYWIAPGVNTKDIGIGSADVYDVIDHPAVRVGNCVVTHNSLFVPMWFPHARIPTPTQVYGYIALLKWGRGFLPLIDNVTVEQETGGYIKLKFPMPVTYGRMVSFAVENPPLGYLPYSYLGSLYIIADSVADSFGWEARVGENEWEPFRGALSRPTATSPPYEIRVRILPVHSNIVRVLAKAI